MQRYRDTVQILRSAIDLMSEQGDSLMVATLTSPLEIAEGVLERHASGDVHPPVRREGYQQQA